MNIRCFVLGCKVSTIVIPATDHNAEWKFTSCSRCGKGYLTDMDGKKHQLTVYRKVI